MKRSILPIALVAAAATLTGSSPVFWQVSTQAELLRGEVDALSVDDEGRLRLGPATDAVLETPEPALWSLARATDGALWMGSGTDGRLYRLGADGTGTVVLDADELDVHALAADREGGVYAGTSPGGRVYRVTAAGEATVVFDPEETYVWALALDGDGALYVATGNPARVYRLPAGGDPALLYASDAAHVLSLAVAGDGTLLAGTESPGQVLRIDPAGRAFVLLDAPFDEIRSLRPQPDGSVLAVAVSGQPAPGASATPPPRPGRGGGPGADGLGDHQRHRGRGRGHRHARRDAGLHHPGREREREGRRVPHHRRRAVGSALGVQPRHPVRRRVRRPGGAGGRHRPERQAVPRVGRAAADGPLGAGPGPAGHAAAAGHRRLAVVCHLQPGKVMRQAGRLAARGTYESEVHDAGAAARWGVMRWRGVTPPGSRIELATRSGNTAIPNDTWSPWSDAYTEASGSPIASPNARYLQWRATLHGGGDASPVLTAVTAAYLPRNLRPEITQLTVHPPGTVFQQTISTGDPPLAGLDERPGSRPATGAVGREGYRKGIQTFRWQASDANRDPLEYSVSYQRDGDTGWHVLRTGLRETVFAWDTTMIPDGAYRVRISASDAAGNAPGAALVGERDSAVFDVDNAPPRIEVETRRREGGRVVLPFTVRDAQSPVQRVEIAAGNADWRVVFPLDGVPDGLVERFEVVLDAAATGPVVIRATDALRNTVSVFGE